jgi:6-phosphogluconate dehydrogenase
MSTQDIALVGLGVMGQNLVRNMERNGYRVSVFNRTAAVTERFMNDHGQGTSIQAYYGLRDLVAALERPRKILLMVKAGAPVDAVATELGPLLEAGDILIDGGNSHFGDTGRRVEQWARLGIHFLGVGISGGEEGALRGPSIMPGGDRDAYRQVEPIFQAIAAKAGDGAPCVAYLGPAGAGHYTKMVHNGIEYAVIQLIAEVYDFLHQGLGLPCSSLAEVFASWNRGELASYLVEITADVLSRIDPETGSPLVEVILDQAEQKGTGRWTVQDALDLGVPIPTISAGVEARSLSALRDQRLEAARIFGGPALAAPGEAKRHLEASRRALRASVVCAYAQGMALLQAASHTYAFGLELAEAARIWRAGCIIRADLLEDVRAAYATQPVIHNLIFFPKFRAILQEAQADWRQVLETMIRLGLPAPALSASLAYFDAYRSARLPANVIQALRDYFGAHTYRRLDREGTFHTEWTEGEPL